MYKDEFVTMLTNDQWVVDHLRGLGRPAIVKLAVCFSALPLGCCSLSQALATGLTAATGQTTTVYGGRPPVYPWLDDTTASPRVPSMGGWIEYNP